ncbi:MAG: MerR family transcriptional regulator [Bacilli bacterium]
MYTIGEVSKIFNIPISTLRYYDKEGFFPNMARSSGIRKFGDMEIETIHVIICLKKSGLKIKDIKQFILWCQEGKSTFSNRLELFKKQKKIVENEIAQLEVVLNMLKYKCWYYEQAEKFGSKEKIHAMLPDKLPDDIQELFNKAHTTFN